MAPGANQADQSESGDAAERLRGRKVLVVDDHFEILELIASVLGTVGCSVLTTESAPAARALLRQVDFDLMITDIVLRDANGFALSAWARALRPDLRLLYISARSQERRLATRPGQGVLLAKPFRLAALVSSVERVLIPRTVH
ncbi:MAG: response regulator [Proteobacteria bacterium]|nr:response regulator [Pseudomonadota bacterium]